MAVCQFGLIKIIHVGGAFTDDLFVDACWSFEAVTLASLACAHLYHAQPPEAKAQDNCGREDAENRRRKEGGAEVCHWDGVLNGWSARQGRHREGKGTKCNRCWDKPMWDCGLLEQCSRHWEYGEGDDEKADTTICEYGTRQHHRHDRP